MPMKTKYCKYAVMKVLCLFSLMACQKSTEEKGIVLSFAPVMYTDQTKADFIAGEYFPNGTYHFMAGIFNHETMDPHKRGYGDVEMLFNPGAGGDGLVQQFKFNFDRVLHNTISVDPLTDLDIVSYYPYLDGQNDYSAVEVPYGVDVMYADPVTVNTGEPDEGITVVDVPLVMHHAMTCIQIDIRSLCYGSVTLNSISLNDPKGRLVKTGTMNIYDNGKITPTERTDKLTWTFTNMSIATEAKTVYLPMAEPIAETEEPYAGDMTITFIFNGVESKESFTIPAESGLGTEIGRFRAGYVYEYRLLFDNTVHFAPLQYYASWYTQNKGFEI